MLTALQERFARAYVGTANGNAAEAVRIAGSQAATPDSRSSLGRKWLTLPKVKERIQSLRDAAAENQLMDRSGRIRELESIVTDPTINVSYRLRALDILNRMHGDYDVLRAVSTPEPCKNCTPMSDAEMEYFMATSRFAPEGMSDREIYECLLKWGKASPKLCEQFQAS